MGLFGRRRNESLHDRPSDGAGPMRATLSDDRVVEIAQRVDCLGDSCPRPQLMTKKALSNAAAQEVIEVLIDNPTSVEAIPPMCPGLGATHLETIKADRQWHVYVRKD